ncbi:hypothetical protein J3A83DRAFT_1498576 [Scleroderma citrinum]
MAEVADSRVLNSQTIRFYRYDDCIDARHCVSEKVRSDVMMLGSMWPTTHTLPLGRHEIPSELISCQETTGKVADHREAQAYKPPYDLLFNQTLPSACWVEPNNPPVFAESRNACTLPISRLEEVDETSGIQTWSAPPPQPHLTNNMSVFSTIPHPLGEWDNLAVRAPGLHVCQWVDEVKPCGAIIRGDKRDIASHLYERHDISPGLHKMQQQCRWLLCSKVMRKESILRHILAVHLRERARCSCGCGLSFARNDSLRRHLRSTKGRISGNSS